MQKYAMQWVARALLVMLSVVWIPARADVVGSEQVLQASASSPQAQQERAAVKTFLARQDVQSRLLAMGVDPQDAAARTQALSDDEVHQLYQHVQSAPAGGMDILGTLVFIFVLLLVTDILGLTKVFPFTRSIRR